MLMFGWADSQWALAFGISSLPFNNIGDALKIKRDYIKRHKMDPIEKAVIYNPKGDERPRDWEKVELLINMFLEKGVKFK